MEIVTTCGYKKKFMSKCVFWRLIESSNWRKMYNANICQRLSHKLINDAYYMPKLKSNILSLGQLLEKGWDSHER